MKLLAIAIGGAAGSLLRYAVSTYTHRFADAGFPWGTLAVNLTGCFLIGFLWEVFDRAAAGPEARALVFIGFLGGFTTFSSFGLETLNLMRDGEFKMAAINIAAQNVAGIALAAGGYLLARATLAR